MTKEKEPKGGWLAPKCRGMKAIAVADGKDKDGNWIWKPLEEPKKSRKKKDAEEKRT